jgi:hypothetical protein
MASRIFWAAAFCSPLVSRGGQPAYGLEHVDGGVVPGCPEMARKHDVPIEDGAHGIAEWFVEIVAFHQYREEARDGPLSEPPRTFENLRQKIEDRGRVALLAGRFAGC